jgi:hypothetical protein
MKVYKVMLWFKGRQQFEVQARDDEQAEVEAIDMLQEACMGVPVDVIDTVAVLSDNQYLDHEELEDRERNINEDDPREGER